MKKLFTGMLMILPVLLLMNCSGKKEETRNEDQAIPHPELYQEVMAVHDEVMPQMDLVMRYKMQAQGAADSLQQAGADSIQVQPYLVLVSVLDSADRSMMNWMRNFRRDYTGMSDQEVEVYLQQEKESMEQVKVLFKEALNRAEKELGE
jgi:hypothetical protein